jgi:antirestriction protein ArdC
MPHLLARANEAMLEAQWLRHKGRALRMEAAIRAGELGDTIVRAASTGEKHRPASGVDQQTVFVADRKS